MEKAFEELFRDHEELSDFIMERGGCPVKLSELRNGSRNREDGANQLPAVWLRRFVAAIEDEVRELGESIPWKWWRHERVDLQNVRVELVDIFHFLLSAAAASGMSGEDFINIYYQKRRINYDRQVIGFKEGDNKQVGADRFNIPGTPDSIC